MKNALNPHTIGKQLILKLKNQNWLDRRPGPVVVVILDGIGIAPIGPANAVHLAATATLDHLFATCPLQCQLRTHGPAVGMPTWSDMGNSEVGHNALGAGRIFPQGASLVRQAIQSKAIFRSDLWQAIVKPARQSGTLHFLGLLSDGNVHSHIDHLLALMTDAAEKGAKRLAVHALFDGRDVEPRSALSYLEKLQTHFDHLEKNYACKAVVASGGGRMHITMDRYQADWQMVERGWQTHVLGQGDKVPSAKAAIEKYYQKAEASDQYIPAFVVCDEHGQPLATINDGDSVLLFNFRGDRAIEISQAFEQKDFEYFDRQRTPKVTYAGMMLYDGDLNIPKNFLVSPPAIDHTVSDYLCAMGERSFVLSETQKYGHVTYFWNGNRSGYVNQKLERYVEIPSDTKAFDQQPQMKAVEITNQAIELIRSGSFDFGRINYPNGDMVGHTGNLPAVIEAVECVDRCLGQLLNAIYDVSGVAIVLADHGNAEEMFTEKNGKKVIKTSHTLNPVPCFLVDKGYHNDYRLAPLEHPGLDNIAATLLNYLGYEKPKEFSDSLIIKK